MENYKGKILGLNELKRYKFKGNVIHQTINRFTRKMSGKEDYL